MKTITLEDGRKVEIYEESYKALSEAIIVDRIPTNLVQWSNINKSAVLKTDKLEMYCCRNTRLLTVNSKDKDEYGCKWEDVKPEDVEVGDIIRFYDNKNFLAAPKLITKRDKSIVITQYFDGAGDIMCGMHDLICWKHIQKAVKDETTRLQ